MTRVMIIVKRGMVQDVYSNEESVDVTVVDLDTEEGLEAEKELEKPQYSVY